MEQLPPTASWDKYQHNWLDLDSVSQGNGPFVSSLFRVGWGTLKSIKFKDEKIGPLRVGCNGWGSITVTCQFSYREQLSGPSPKHIVGTPSLKVWCSICTAKNLKLFQDL